MLAKIKPAARKAAVALGVMVAAFITYQVSDAIAEPADGHVARPPIGSFERVATYDVTGEVAEIIASTLDGKTLI